MEKSFTRGGIFPVQEPKVIMICYLSCRACAYFQINEQFKFRRKDNTIYKFKRISEHFSFGSIKIIYLSNSAHKHMVLICAVSRLWKMEGGHRTYHWEAEDCPLLDGGTPDDLNGETQKRNTQQKKLNMTMEYQFLYHIMV